MSIFQKSRIVDKIVMTQNSQIGEHNLLEHRKRTMWKEAKALSDLMEPNLLDSFSPLDCGVRLKSQLLI